MLNKILNIFFILFLIITISNICYATGDVVMDLNATNTSNEDIDNTIYSSENLLENEVISNSDDTFSDIPSDDYNISNDYDVSSDDLSISNIINIIFIVVGIVLILLGIAIILKLK